MVTTAMFQGRSAIRKLNIGIAILVMGMFLLPAPGFAEGKLSLRLQGAGTYILGGDVNRGTKAFFYSGTWVVQSGGYQGVHYGYEFGGDLIFALTPRLGFGIGGGLMQISHHSYMSISPNEPSLSSMLYFAEPRLSAIPIRAGLYLTWPWRGKFNILTDFGLSCYFRARYSEEQISQSFIGGSLSLYTLINTQAENKTIPIGFHAGISLEYELGRNLWLYLGARGRYARFQGWEGTSIVESNYDPPVSELEQGILYYEVVPMLYNEPRLIMVQSSPPDGPGGKPRQAAIDFSGVSLQLGIRIRL
jgi:hypothetical protein